MNQKGLLKNVKNPYGVGGASLKIVKKLISFLKSPIENKIFIDS